jgi:hypothetical protein
MNYNLWQICSIGATTCAIEKLTRFGIRCQQSMLVSVGVIWPEDDFGAQKEL